MTFIFKVEKKRLRVVVFYNRETGEKLILESAQVNRKTRPSSILIRKLKNGRRVVRSNSLEEMRKVTAEVDLALAEIQKKHSDLQERQLNRVVFREWKIRNRFVFVFVQKGVRRRIVVDINKKTQVVTIVKDKLITKKQKLVKPMPLPIVSVKPEKNMEKKIKEVLGKQN